MLPIVGLQMLVVFFLAMIVRANLPIIIALQWISNPFSMGQFTLQIIKLERSFFTFGWD